MPDDPVAEVTQSPQVQPSADLPMNVTAQGFGAGVGAAAENAAEIATRIHHDAYQAANQTAILNYQNGLEQWGQQRVYGQKGVLSQPSLDKAPGVADQTLKDFDEFASKQQASAANEEQRIAFQRAAQGKRYEMEKHLDAYAHAETTRFADQTDEAAIGNAATAAAQNPYDHEHVTDSIGKMQAVIADRGARKGTAPELIKLQQSEAASGTHLAVMEQMAADGNDAAAKQYFTANSGAFQGQDLLRAKKMVEIGDRSDQARTVADGVLNKVYGDAVDGSGNFDQSAVSMEKALAELNKQNIADTRVYDAAKARIIGDFRTREEAHTSAQRDTLQRAADYLEDPGNETHELPANLMASLDDHNRRYLEVRQGQLRKAEEPESDPETRGRFLAMAADKDSWDAFAAIPPQQWRPFLSDKDYARYEEELAHVKGRIAARDDTLSQGAISFKAIDDLLGANGMRLTQYPRGSDAYKQAEARRDALVQQLHKSVAADALDKKRPLTDVEVHDKAQELLATQTITRDATAWEKATSPSYLAGWAPNLQTEEKKPTFELPWAKELAYGRRDIPAAELQKMLAREKASGYTRSDAERVQDYNNGIIKKYTSGANAR